MKNKEKKLLKNKIYLIIKILLLNLFILFLAFLISLYIWSYICMNFYFGSIMFFLIFLAINYIFIKKFEVEKNEEKYKYKISKVINILIFLWILFFNIVSIFAYYYQKDNYAIDWDSYSWWKCQDRDTGKVLHKKPIIYLYPQKTQKIKVKLDYNGEIIADYPEYDEKIKGWEVLAYPDSRVVDLRDGKEYSYLFWEWMPKEKIDWDLNNWFVVEWKNARKFLREKLEYLWLTPKEYNEFIVYWYPKMMNNKYNLVHFATKKYTDNAPLEITPKPDSMLRVFMIMKKLDKKINIKEQKLKKFERKWFTVIEWGGSEVE